MSKGLPRVKTAWVGKENNKVKTERSGWSLQLTYSVYLKRNFLTIANYFTCIFIVLFYPTTSLLSKYRVHGLAGKIIHISRCLKDICTLFSCWGPSNISTPRIPCYQKHSSAKYTAYPLINEPIHTRSSLITTQLRHKEQRIPPRGAKRSSWSADACCAGSFASRPRDDSTGPAAALSLRSPRTLASVGFFCLYPGTGSNHKLAAPFDGFISLPCMTPSTFIVSLVLIEFVDYRKGPIGTCQTRRHLKLTDRWTHTRTHTRSQVHIMYTRAHEQVRIQVQSYKINNGWREAVVAGWLEWHYKIIQEYVIALVFSFCLSWGKMLCRLMPGYCRRVLPL